MSVEPDRLTKYLSGHLNLDHIQVAWKEEWNKHNGYGFIPRLVITIKDIALTIIHRKKTPLSTPDISNISEKKPTNSVSLSSPLSPDSAASIVASVGAQALLGSQAAQAAPLPNPTSAPSSNNIASAVANSPSENPLSSHSQNENPPSSATNPPDLEEIQDSQPPLFPKPQSIDPSNPDPSLDDWWKNGLSEVPNSAMPFSDDNDELDVESLEAENPQELSSSQSSQNPEVQLPNSPNTVIEPLFASHRDEENFEWIELNRKYYTDEDKKKEFHQLINQKMIREEKGPVYELAKKLNNLDELCSFVEKIFPTGIRKYGVRNILDDKGTPVQQQVKLDFEENVLGNLLLDRGDDSLKSENPKLSQVHVHSLIATIKQIKASPKEEYYEISFQNLSNKASHFLLPVYMDVYIADISQTMKDNGGSSLPWWCPKISVPFTGYINKILLYPAQKDRPVNQNVIDSVQDRYNTDSLKTLILLEASNTKICHIPIPDLKSISNSSIPRLPEIAKFINSKLLQSPAFFLEEIDKRFFWANRPEQIKTGIQTLLDKYNAELEEAKKNPPPKKGKFSPKKVKESPSPATIESSSQERPVLLSEE